eukprot:5852760-Amphidinium_carterae.1
MTKAKALLQRLVAVCPNCVLQSAIEAKAILCSTHTHRHLRSKPPVNSLGTKRRKRYRTYLVILAESLDSSFSPLQQPHDMQVVRSQEQSTAGLCLRLPSAGMKRSTPTRECRPFKEKGSIC